MDREIDRRGLIKEKEREIKEIYRKIERKRDSTPTTLHCTEEIRG